MTLQEAKDQVARNNGHADWNEWSWVFSEPYGGSVPQVFLEEAAELYARSKWAEACEEQIQVCNANKFAPMYGLSIPKAEFKP